jgi:hypothetical protein
MYTHYSTVSHTAICIYIDSKWLKTAFSCDVVKPAILLAISLSPPPPFILAGLAHSKHGSGGKEINRFGIGLPHQEAFVCI